MSFGGWLGGERLGCGGRGGGAALFGVECMCGVSIYVI